MKRKNWIDWCKLFALYLVILGHFSPNRDILTSWLYTFHIPLFFIISGYLCSNKMLTLKDSIIHNTKTLLIPYTIFVLLEYLIEVSINKMNHIECSNIFSALIGIPPGRSSPMWFIACLFIVKMTDWFERYLKSKSLYLSFFFNLIIIAISLTISNYLISIKIPIAWFFLAYPYFLFGRLLKKYNLIIFQTSFQKVSLIAKKIMIAVLFVIVPLCFVAINGNVDMYYCSFGENGFLYYLFGIIASLTTMVFFRFFLDIENIFTTTMTKGSIMIVAMHRLLLWPFEQYSDLIVVRLLVPLVVCCIFYYPIRIIIKYSPFMLGNRK